MLKKSLSSSINLSKNKNILKIDSASNAQQEKGTTGGSCNKTGSKCQTGSKRQTGNRGRTRHGG